MSRISADESIWPGTNHFHSMSNKLDPSKSPASPPGRSAPASTPRSGGPPFNPLELNAPDIGPNGLINSSGPPNFNGTNGVYGNNALALHRPSAKSQNPSPPSSVASKSRVSDGTLSDQRSRRYGMMEDLLRKHYAILKRFMQGQGREDLNASRASKARDKLLRLSPGQVMELSTDVYDELLRRQAQSPNRPGGNRPDVPPYLLPRQEFHEKRNQARQKLSTLLQPRFIDLAADVLCELERRLPHFANMDPASRRMSPALSVRSVVGGGYASSSNGYDPRPGSNDSSSYGTNSYPAPLRTQSRGPGPGGLGLRGGLPPDPHPPSARFPPRQGSLNASTTGLDINVEMIPENGPLPKSFQSNTIVPNKSTMVEEDVEGSDEGGEDDGEIDYVHDGVDGVDGMQYEDDDPDRRSDAFALDKVLESRKETTMTLVGNGNGAGLGVGVDSEREKEMLAEARGQVSKLEKRVDELEAQLKEKVGEADRLRAEVRGNSDSLDSERQQWESMRKDWDRKREEWDKMKSHLEAKLLELQNLQHLNVSLQDQLEGERREYENREQDLRQQIQQALTAAAAARNTDLEMGREIDRGRGRETDIDSGVWKSRAEDSERENQELKEELQKQREVTEQVRKEASNFLQEMRALSDRTQERWEREERLTQDFHRMEEEVKLWKNRYAKTKTQLQHLRSPSLGLPGHNIQDVATIAATENDISHPDGLVNDVHLTKFQISIDELLRTARMADPAYVLEQMKAVVFAVRHITQDVESAQSNGKAADDQLTPSSHIRSRAKIRVSATANNLITASKDFANSNGISPVSLLDAAASHLSAAIVDLIRIVRVRPTPAEEIEDNDGVGDGDDLDAIMQSPTYFSVPSSLDRLSGNESVYSAISSPHSAQHSRMASVASGAGGHMQMHRKTFSNGQMLGKTGLGIEEVDGELEELRVYLEEQTDGVVQSIQALVSSIRAEPDDMSAIRVHIDAISSVVSRIISMTENAMAQEQLKQQKHPSTSNDDNNNSSSSSSSGSSDNSSSDNGSSSGSNSSSSSNNLRDRAGPIIRNLSCCRDRLAKEGALGGKAMSVVEVRDVMGKLLPIAFEIARETKELVQRLDMRWV
ncbi:hypothetical protein ACO22_00258 [Paracoccidioides brasiliensis]|uniref:GIT Spa2 homology (SHD) domain-containing protein n=1 Tax=Paracoccidioides brasiliensis TaxID=121759 RepID=A0A1D2JQ04_PARBR|nr:hypothetical protein ACO22_00258 [Paracoccidioides brasiliensis]